MEPNMKITPAANASMQRSDEEGGMTAAVAGSAEEAGCSKSAGENAVQGTYLGHGQSPSKHGWQLEQLQGIHTPGSQRTSLLSDQGVRIEKEKAGRVVHASDGRGLEGLQLLGGATAAEVFEALDADGSGFVDEEELVVGMARLGVQLGEEDVEAIREQLGQTPLQVDLPTFESIVARAPAANSQDKTEGWLLSLGLHKLLAPVIQERAYTADSSKDSDGMGHVRAMQEEDVRRLLRSTADAMTHTIMQGIQRLRAQRSNRSAGRAAGVANSKFAMGGEGTRTATFARLDDFHHGLEKMIGLPNARVYDGMKAEHCHRADSDDVFTTSNYGLDTTSRREWEFVVSPGPGLYPGEADRGAHDPHKRVRQSIADLLEHPKIQAAALSKVELIALRLYTGPMFMKYNAVLRGFPQAVIDKCKGNRYVTTLHAIVSGVRKLAQVEELPKGRTVFRGLGGMMLPEAFHQPDEFGCRGGVEFAFLSTTTKREVAVQYSGTGAGLPTIFEIAVGQVDRGASLKVLSQYAGEEEILMPPLSNLEVVGDAWMDEGCMVVPLRINVNLKSATIDELVERRKLLHMDMLHNLTSEAALALENHALSANLLHGSLLHALVVAAGQRLMDEYRSKGSEHGARDPEEFNEDAKYKLLINEAVDYKRQALSIHTSIVFRARILQGVIDPNCESASPATDPQQQRAVDPRQQSMPMRTSSAAQARKIVDLDLHSLAVGDVGARSAHNRNLCRAIHAQTASDAAAL